METSLFFPFICMSYQFYFHLFHFFGRERIRFWKYPWSSWSNSFVSALPAKKNDRRQDVGRVLGEELFDFLNFFLLFHFLETLQAVFYPNHRHRTERSTYMWARQELLHDVGVINLPASAKAVFLILKLLIFFYLDFSKLTIVRYIFPEKSLY